MKVMIKPIKYRLNTWLSFQKKCWQRAPVSIRKVWLPHLVFEASVQAAALYSLVPVERLELPLHMKTVPKTVASTNFAIQANYAYLYSKPNNMSINIFTINGCS